MRWIRMKDRGQNPLLIFQQRIIKIFADAMFAPVVTRFRTYGVSLDGAAQEYAEALFAFGPMKTWMKEALAPLGR